MIASKAKDSCQHKNNGKKQDTVEKENVQLNPTKGPKEVKNVSEKSYVKVSEKSDVAQSDKSNLTLSSLDPAKMAEIKKQVEEMIREGKTDADSLNRIDTLKHI